MFFMLHMTIGVTARRIVEVIGNEFLPKTMCIPKTEINDLERKKKKEPLLYALI